jgi:hypothetical protein
VHDLVGIATQHELPRLLQAGQRLGKLHVGKVLHLVDDDEVVLRLRQGPPLMRDEVQVEQTRLGQPLPVALEQRMGRLASRAGQQGLTWPQGQVGGQVQRAGRAGTEHTAEFLEQRVGVQLTERAAKRLAMPLEPAAEGRKCHLAADWDVQRLDELAVAQEFGLLRRVLVAVGAVLRARRLREIG